MYGMACRSALINPIYEKGVPLNYKAEYPGMIIFIVKQ